MTRILKPRSLTVRPLHISPPSGCGTVCTKKGKQGAHLIMPTLILADSIEGLNALLKGLIRCCERDPDMSISLGKDVAGNNEEILLNGFLDKGLSVSSRHFRIGIKSALRLLDV